MLSSTCGCIPDGNATSQKYQVLDGAINVPMVKKEHAKRLLVEGQSFCVSFKCMVEISLNGLTCCKPGTVEEKFFRGFLIFRSNHKPNFLISIERIRSSDKSVNQKLNKQQKLTSTMKNSFAKLRRFRALSLDFEKIVSQIVYFKLQYHKIQDRFTFSETSFFVLILMLGLVSSLITFSLLTCFKWYSVFFFNICTGINGNFVYSYQILLQVLQKQQQHSEPVYQRLQLVWVFTRPLNMITCN